MTEIQHERMQEDNAYDEYLIQTIAKSCGFSGDEKDLTRRIDKAVYKGTDCGAWVRFDEKGIMIGTIVEGSDAEFSQRIDLTGVEDNEELLRSRFWAAIQKAEDFSSEVWAEMEAENND